MDQTKSSYLFPFLRACLRASLLSYTMNRSGRYEVIGANGKAAWVSCDLGEGHSDARATHARNSSLVIYSQRWNWLGCLVWRVRCERYRATGRREKSGATLGKQVTQAGPLIVETRLMGSLGAVSVRGFARRRRLSPLVRAASLTTGLPQPGTGRVSARRFSSALNGPSLRRRPLPGFGPRG